MKALSTTLLWAFCLFITPIYAQWQRIPVPFGGNVRSITRNATTVWCLNGEYLFRSDNWGDTWNRVAQSKTIERFTEIMAGKDALYATYLEGQAVYKSTDQGQTWEIFYNNSVKSLLVVADTVLLASSFEVKRHIAPDGPVPVTASIGGSSNDRFVYHNGEYFFMSGSSLYRSNDSGQNWAKVFEGQGNITELRSTPAGLYLYNGQVVRSTDGFRMFSAENPTPFLPYNTEKFEFFAAGDTLWAFIQLQSPWINDCEFAKRYSLDQGKTWQIPNEANPSLPFAFRGYVPINGGYLVAHERGVVFANAAFNTFSKRDNGLLNTWVFSVLTHYNRLLGKIFGDYFIYDSTAEQWERIPLGNDDRFCTSSSVYLVASKERIYQRGSDGIYVVNPSTGDRQPLFLGPEFATLGPWATENGVWGIDFASNEILFLPDRSQTASRLDIASTVSGQWGWGLVQPKNFVIADTAGTRYFVGEDMKIEFEISQIPVCASPDWLIYVDEENYYQICGSESAALRKGTTDWERYSPVDFTTGRPIHFDTIAGLSRYGKAMFVVTKQGKVYVSADNTARFFPLAEQLDNTDGGEVTQVWIRDNQLWLNMGTYIYHLPISPQETSTNDQPTFTCSPNPSQGVLNLQADRMHTELLYCSIVDAAGRLCVGETAIYPGNSWTLDYSHLPNGLYFLTVSGSWGREVVKWVKY